MLHRHGPEHLNTQPCPLPSSYQFDPQSYQIFYGAERISSRLADTQTNNKKKLKGGNHCPITPTCNDSQCHMARKSPLLTFSALLSDQIAARVTPLPLHASLKLKLLPELISVQVLFAPSSLWRILNEIGCRSSSGRKAQSLSLDV